MDWPDGYAKVESIREQTVCRQDERKAYFAIRSEAQAIEGESGFLMGSQAVILAEIVCSSWPIT
jgi:hypothetical protein